MSLRIQTVNKQLKEYEQIKEIMISSFPQNERLPMWFLLWKAKTNFVDFLALFDDDRLVGLTYLITSRDLTFVMYLAIDSNIRSKGYGQKALEIIQSQHPNNRIILNIEAIEEGAHNYEQRVKRKFFYTRNGFVNTALQYSEGEDKYEVLISKGSCTVEEYQQLYKKLTGSLIYYFFRNNIKKIGV